MSKATISCNSWLCVAQFLYVCKQNLIIVALTSEYSLRFNQHFDGKKPYSFNLRYILEWNGHILIDFFIDKIMQIGWS